MTSRPHTPDPTADLCEVINRRRDVRAEFSGEPVPDSVCCAAFSPPRTTGPPKVMSTPVRRRTNASAEPRPDRARAAPR